MDWILFDPSGFPARWYCGEWTWIHGTIHIGSHMAIFLAYMAIPLLIYLVVKMYGSVFPHPRVAILFIFFIGSCGISHLIDSLMFWWPAYRFLGLNLLVTAICSWSAVIGLQAILPKVLIKQSIHNRELVSSKLRQEHYDQGTEFYIYAVSHDLKAPLRGMSNMIDFLEEDLIQEVLKGPIPDAQKEQIEMIRSRIRRMESMIRGLLSYVKLGGSYRPELHPAKELVEEAVALVNDSAKVSVFVHPSSAVWSDKILLQQVIRNLVSNAIEHHDREERRISVRLLKRDNWWRLLVCDDGPGIPDIWKKKIFRPFATIGAKKGDDVRGMGLAMVKIAALRMGAYLEVKDGEPRGTCFEVRWPDQNPSG